MLERRKRKELPKSEQDGDQEKAEIELEKIKIKIPAEIKRKELKGIKRERIKIRKELKKDVMERKEKGTDSPPALSPLRPV